MKTLYTQGGRKDLFKKLIVSTQSKLINSSQEIKSQKNNNLENKSIITLDRFYSSKVPIRKVNFNIDSPIYLELQRIITNSKLDKPYLLILLCNLLLESLPLR